VSVVYQLRKKKKNYFFFLMIIAMEINPIVDIDTTKNIPNSYPGIPP
jgi:hypothetical protein